MKIRIRDIHTGIEGAGVPIPIVVRRTLDRHLGRVTELNHLMGDLEYDMVGEFGCAYYAICKLTHTKDMILLEMSPEEDEYPKHCWRLCFYDEVTDEV